MTVTPAPARRFGKTRDFVALATAAVTAVLVAAEALPAVAWDPRIVWWAFLIPAAMAAITVVLVWSGERRGRS